MPHVLIVLTGADHWTLNDGTQHPTGFWAEELLAPVEVFRDAGIDMTFATPGGVRPAVDEGSLRADAVGGEEKAAELRKGLEGLSGQLASP
ncbi:MAG: type 1 glutamine amidotransferase domain-containing protein, partial [Actinomycetota bacterium]|nr:type 1 glutamine amidotransferase domain-containing protein [Actinomycetota bacterium]